MIISKFLSQVVVLSFVGLAMTGCPTTDKVTPKPVEKPFVPADENDGVVDNTLCKTMCEKLKKLGCEQAEPVTLNVQCNMECSSCSSKNKCIVTCEEHCENTYRPNSQCISSASNCEDAKACTSYWLERNSTEEVVWADECRTHQVF